MCGAEVKTFMGATWAPFFAARVRPELCDEFIDFNTGATKTMWCTNCLTSMPCHEFTIKELEPIYCDYFQESYLHQRYVMEQPFFPNWHKENYVGRPYYAEVERAGDFLAKYLKPKLGETAMDFGSSDWKATPKWMRDNYICEQYDPYRLQENAGKLYDLVICRHVLEHVGNPKALIDILVTLGKTVFIEIPLEAVGPVGQQVHEHLNLYSKGSLLKSGHDYFAYEDDINPGRYLIRGAA